ncbi:hypothetical protein [Pseudomonas sp. ATCC 13867]|uniref:hypothetical protein n=1 Tax=Pseudomonas sp. ATCC 13867 TaxID=1294143 RepID=UPI0012FF320A|nr:hypothetical protein [Pseudomonas sp. ATCC 13867]
MGYLILQRNKGEEVVLSVAPEVSDAELIRQLRGDGIRVLGEKGDRFIFYSKS